MAIRYGYFLSSEEHDPRELVRQARMAEDAGFEALWISDHYHPWLDEQGQSGFVWSVIGAVAQATSLPVTTAVTCPTIRIHPAIIAQAAATSALLADGRFVLGVGSGEALNEHILGTRWPSAAERLEMLEEAVGVMRDLWAGKLVSHRGPYYTVETARLYSVPQTPPPVYMSGFGPKAIDVAARVADGYMCVQPNAGFVQRYRDAGGKGPAQGGLKVCWAEDAAQARKTVYRLWPNEELPGEAAQLLQLPRHFSELTELICEEDISAPCGPDPDVHIDAIRAYTDAGFDEVYIAQIGPEQKGFFEFYATQVLPALRSG
jgi:G6PDH family F420-dependent oxidoreductase